MAEGRARRFATAFLLACAAAAWAAYWGGRFFEARGRAEAAMDKLQPLLVRASQTRPSRRRSMPLSPTPTAPSPSRSALRC